MSITSYARQNCEIQLAPSEDIQEAWSGFMPVLVSEVDAAALLGSVITVATASTIGKHGGVLVVAQSSEPKTFNPVIAVDQPTRHLSVLSADLIHINRRTLRTELALAKSCSVTRDGRHYTLTLRDGLRFSDGSPLTADDVVFTFAVHLDPRVNSPQRDLLLVNGQPIAVTKLSSASVRVDLPAPYAPGERLFDSFWILPRHKLERAYAEGRFAQAWTLGSTPAEIATGSVPLQAVPGQRTHRRDGIPTIEA
jgi:peptide/nickel transport system substrate-binding protein